MSSITILWIKLTVVHWVKLLQWQGWGGRVDSNSVYPTDLDVLYVLQRQELSIVKFKFP
jgi:hypothetical protein